MYCTEHGECIVASLGNSARVYVLDSEGRLRRLVDRLTEQTPQGDELTALLGSGIFDVRNLRVDVFDLKKYGEGSVGILVATSGVYCTLTDDELQNLINQILLKKDIPDSIERSFQQYLFQTGRINQYDATIAIIEAKPIPER